MALWLFDSLMLDSSTLVNELGLVTDRVLFEKLQKETLPQEKAKLELNYIEETNRQIDNLLQKLEASEKSTKWDSWPKIIREHKGINCVGATLLGMHFLEESGIRSFYGRPYGHSVNIAKLADGSWQYLDFRKGKRNIKRIMPEKIQLAGEPALKINQPDIEYHLIPICENIKITGSILRNLSQLKIDAQDAAIPDEDIDKQAAQKYLREHEEMLQSTDLTLLHEILYPEFIALSQTSEMQKEKERLSKKA